MPALCKGIFCSSIIAAIFGVTHKLVELGGAIPMMESLIEDGAQTLMGFVQVKVEPDLLTWWVDQLSAP